jgi:glyoxylase-like metal-dependent hydrolase (beta-lactamase superfamily II)
MKKYLLALLCLALPVSADVEEFRLQKVSEGVYWIQERLPYRSNLMLLESADSLLLVSTPVSSAATERFFSWVEGRFHKPVRIAINPHFHPDGSAGNQVLRAHGVEVYASAATIRLQGALEGRRIREGADAVEDATLAQEMRSTPVVTANRELKLPQTMTFGRLQIRMEFPGASHSPDHILVEVDHVLFGGCMTFDQDRNQPGFIGDADLQSWIKVMTGLQSRKFTYVIPGHGEMGGHSLLPHTLEVLTKASHA